MIKIKKTFRYRVDVNKSHIELGAYTKAAILYFKMDNFIIRKRLVSIDASRSLKDLLSDTFCYTVFLRTKEL